MARKTESDGSGRLGEIIGLLLLLIAGLLLVAQCSFDWRDLPAFSTHPNKPAHNWIGLFGAHLASGFFFVFGLAAYVFPFIFGVFGIAHLTHFLPSLRERRVWYVSWSTLFV